MFSLKLLHTRLESPFYVLVATDRPDDRLLIAQSLQDSIGTIQLNYALTAEQIQQSLLDQATEYYCFPRLLILDLQIAERQVVWQLVRDLRLTYPILPIVLISSNHYSETIQQAYHLGINAFVKKPADWTEWKTQLISLAHYWLKVVSLPKQSVL